MKVSRDEARRLVIGSGIAFTSNIDMANGNLQSQIWNFDISTNFRI